MRSEWIVLAAIVCSCLVALFSREGESAALGKLEKRVETLEQRVFTLENLLIKNIGQANKE